MPMSPLVSIVADVLPPVPGNPWSNIDACEGARVRVWLTGPPVVSMLGTLEDGALSMLGEVRVTVRTDDGTAVHVPTRYVRYARPGE